MLTVQDSDMYEKCMHKLEMAIAHLDLPKCFDSVQTAHATNVVDKKLGGPHFIVCQKQFER